MTVEASIDLEAEEKVFSFPDLPLFRRTNSNYVYKLSEGRAVRHEVVLGALSGEEIAVAQGLERGGRGNR